MVRALARRTKEAQAGGEAGEAERRTFALTYTLACGSMASAVVANKDNCLALNDYQTLITGSTFFT